MAVNATFLWLIIMFGLAGVLSCGVFAYTANREPRKVDIEMQRPRRTWFRWAKRGEQHELTEQGTSASNPPQGETVSTEDLFGARGRARRLFERSSLDRTASMSLGGPRSAPPRSMTNPGARETGKGKNNAVRISEPSPALLKTAVGAYRVDASQLNALPEEGINPYRPYDLPPIRPVPPMEVMADDYNSRPLSDTTASSFHGESAAQSADQNASGSRAAPLGQQTLQGVTGGRNLMRKTRK